jgi:hypothetical protein
MIFDTSTARMGTMADAIYDDLKPRRPEGGVLDEEGRKDGLGEVSPEQDVHPNP